MKSNFIITIDGPCAAGKTTMAKNLSQMLDCIYLDTGALYRAAACCALTYGVDIDNPSPQQLSQLANTIPKTIRAFKGENGVMGVMLGKDDITSDIRTQAVDNASSKISVYRPVRDAIGELEQTIAKKGSIVAEGRDTGTVGFPNADLKIYLTATDRARAIRRWAMRKHQGDVNDVLKELRQRDYRDSHRDEAPLRVPDGAYIIDTTDLGVKEVSTLLHLLARTVVERRPDATGLFPMNEEEEI